MKQKIEKLRREMNQMFEAQYINVENILEKSQELDVFILDAMLESNINYIFPDLNEDAVVALIEYIEKIRIRLSQHIAKPFISIRK